MPRNPFLDQTPIQEFPLTSYYLQNKLNAGSSVSSSYSQTSSYSFQSVSSSYADNGFPYIGSEASITGQLQITGSYVIQPIRVNVEVDKTASIPCSQGNIFTLDLITRDNTYLTFTDIQPGQLIYLQITQPNPSGSMTYDSSIIKFPSGSSYSPTSLDSAIDVLYFTSFNTSSLLCYSMKNFV